MKGKWIIAGAIGAGVLVLLVILLRHRSEPPPPAQGAATTPGVSAATVAAASRPDLSVGPVRPTTDDQMSAFFASAQTPEMLPAAGLAGKWQATIVNIESRNLDPAAVRLDLSKAPGFELLIHLEQDKLSAQIGQNSTSYPLAPSGGWLASPGGGEMPVLRVALRGQELVGFIESNSSSLRMEFHAKRTP